jgi:hypothetical protein
MLEKDYKEFSHKNLPDSSSGHLTIQETIRGRV